MVRFICKLDKKSGKRWVETSLTGKELLRTTFLNKDTAFSYEERCEFDLLGKLPYRIETLDEQVRRAYEQMHRFDNDLQKNTYLTALLDRNETIFYKLATKHIKEITPLIYTPIVGAAVKNFSREFRSPRGLYISYPDIDKIDEILDNRTHPEIDVIVVSDGEAILGIGDQGVGGMDIPIAKIMVYTLCGGVHPGKTLPIFLDVGTNNEELLNDPLYLGWRHHRISETEYDHFMEKFVAAVKRKFPNIFLHWEDFGRNNARRLLNLYQDQLCTFNDDIQGTAAVAVAAILSGVKVKQQRLAEQRIIVFGAGSAGMGIADFLRDAMMREGMSAEEASQRFWLFDRSGLLIEGGDDLADFHLPYVRKRTEVADWPRSELNRISLVDAVELIKPTVLIGCSAVSGAFSEIVVTKMASYVDYPIILPLSNPTERAEATPQDLLEWTNGKVMMATGSPFSEVNFRGRMVRIAQSNNALVFPGIGLGIIAVNARRVTQAMLWAACEMLSSLSPALKNPLDPLLPDLDEARSISRKVAHAVAVQAIRDGHAEEDPEYSVAERIEHAIWEPEYVALKKIEI